MGHATGGGRIRVVIVVAAIVALAGCSSSTKSPRGTTSPSGAPPSPRVSTSVAATGAPGRPGALAEALRYVPAGTNEVYFTDWAAAGHPHDLSSSSARLFGSQFSQYSAEVRRQLGAFPTDAEWEVVALPGDSTVLRFARTAELDAIAHGLAALGWSRAGTAARPTYTCRPGGSCQATQQMPGWAYHSDFAIDRTAGILVQYESGAAPSLPSATLAGSAAVRALLASAPPPVSATLRVGKGACGDVYSWFRDPSLAPRLRDRLAAVQQGLGRVAGTLIAVDTSTARTGTAAVVLSSPAVARGESIRRAGVADQLVKLADTDPTGLTIRPAGTVGPVARYTITAKSGRDLTSAASSGRIGVDLCPRTIAG